MSPPAMQLLDLAGDVDDDLYDTLCLLSVINLQWGVCGPSDCTPTEMFAFANLLLNLTANALLPENKTLQVLPRSEEKITSQSQTMNQFSDGAIVYM